MATTTSSWVSSTNSTQEVSSVLRRRVRGCDQTCSYLLMSIAGIVVIVIIVSVSVKNYQNKKEKRWRSKYMKKQRKRPHSAGSLESPSTCTTGELDSNGQQKTPTTPVETLLHYTGSVEHWLQYNTFEGAENPAFDCEEPESAEQCSDSATGEQQPPQGTPSRNGSGGPSYMVHFRNNTVHPEEEDDPHSVQIVIQE